MANLVIGLVTFNNPDSELKKGLGHIARAVEFCEDIVRVLTIDNGEARELSHPSLAIKKLPSEGNIGFGRAMNLLMAKAFEKEEADYFLCLNPDGGLHPKALKELMTMAAQYPNAVIEGAQFPEEHPKPYDKSDYSTPWCSGACFLYPRKLFDEVGGFDDNFFMYMEDVDLSWRVRSAGFELLHCPKALFSHNVVGRKPSTVTERMFLESGRYLAYKWGHRRFQNWIEKELVGRGFFKSRKELPSLPAAPRGKLNKSVCDFDNHFTFAPARW